MGFILKTNGRKLRSGAKIQAKIVTEDKKSFMKVPYEFLIQIKELSNKEKVLRDAQQVASLLDAANNVQDNEYTITGNVIQQITSLTNQQGSYGSWIDKPLFSQYGNETYVNRDDGRILQKPKYNPQSPTNSVPITMTINVHIGEGENYASTNITRTIRIPSYNPNQIINGYIRQSMIEGNIWNFIKLNNVNKDRVITKLKDSTSQSQSELQSDFNSHFTFTIDGETKHLDDVLIGGLNVGLNYPVISINREEDGNTSRIDFGNDVWATGDRLTAKEACRLSNNNDLNGRIIKINPVKNLDLTAAEKEIMFPNGHDDSKNNYNNVIAYSIYYLNTDTPCEAKITCSLNGPNDTRISEDYSLPIKYLSRPVDYRDILSNIEQSGMLSWFLARAYFNDPTYSSANASLYRSTVDTSSGSPGPTIFNLSKAGGYNLVLRVPTSISSLHVDGRTDDCIIDNNNIGYEVKSDGTVLGFSINRDMFYYELKLNTQCKVYTGDYVPPINISTPLDESILPNSNSAGNSVRVGNSDNDPIPKYLFIANGDLPVGDITGEFSIYMKANALTSGNTGQVAYVIKYHFKIKITP